MSAHDFIIVLDYASLAVMAVVTAIICFHVESYMQKFASYASILLTICSIGFLFKAEASNLETLIFGQRIVYAMISHATLSMLVFILAYCKYTMPNWLLGVCVAVDMLISALAMTIPYNTLFYKSYWAVDAGGYLLLDKVYGPGHTFALIVLLLYMVATIIITIVYTVQNLRKHSRNVWKLMIAVMIPYSSYILPKLMDTENELQPLTFAVFLVVIVVMIYRENLYDVNNLLTHYALDSNDDALVVFNRKGLYEGSNQLAQMLFPALARAGIETDIRGELPIFEGILNGTVKEYQSGDQIYDITVKDIEGIEKVAGKTVLFENVTLQRNYTELLENQNKNLETEVTDLYDKSHTDQLTGLPNRRSYEELVEQIKNTDTAKNTLIGCFDVNGLKETNDTIGHSAGDELLISCGRILNDVFGQEGKAFRMGGDEFTVVILSPQHPLSFYTDALNEKMRTCKGQLIDEVSMAYGFADGSTLPDRSITELERIADQKMYGNKKKYHAEHDSKAR